MKSQFKIILIFCAVLVPCFFIARAQADTIFISQLQTTGGTGHTEDDFIELFNPNAAPFNLSGYRLVKRSAGGSTDTSIKSWTSDTYIPPYGYFLWANASYTSISLLPDEVNSGTIADDNGVAIRQGSTNTGALIDSVSWGAAANGFINVSTTNPGAGQSLVRADLFSSSSAFTIGPSSPHNSQSAAVAPPVVAVSPVATTTPANATSTPPDTSSTTPSSDQTTTPSYSAFVKISEILPNPSGADSGNEAVELVNSDTIDADVSNWFLDDESSTGVTSNTYQLSASSTVPAGGFLVVIIPAGHFSLNNTGGDTVNLYFPDKRLADFISYTDAAPENQSYQIVNGTWVWGPSTLGVANVAPQPVQQSSGGGSNSSNSTAIAVPVTTIQLSEFLPNPAGDDAGKEWVELYNFGSATATVSGWKIDDKGSSNTPSASAYTLGAGQTVGPKSFLVVTIPSGKFILNDSASDAVRLFKPDGSLQETVTYANAPEGQSYGRDTAGNWQFGTPTPGAINIANIPPANIIISEVLPNPAGDDDEFVELYNQSTTTPVDLKGFKLLLGAREKVFDPFVLASSSYYALYEDDLPVKLRNSGQTVKLLDTLGRELSSVTYNKAAKGQAYAWSGADFAWTELPTPGGENQLVLGATTLAPAALETPAAPKKVSISSVSAKVLKQDEQKIADLEQRITALEQQPIVLPALAAGVSQPAAPEPSSSRDWTGNLALVLAGLALLVVIAKQFFLK